MTNNVTINPITEPGIDAANAYKLGQLEQNLTIQEAVGGNDAGDVYEFTIAQAGEFTFNLSNLGADADLYIYDANGETVELIGGSENVGTQAETLVGDLAAGTYYLEVNSYDGVETTYSLNIDTTEVDGVISPWSDPGQDFENAYQLGQIEQNLIIEEAVGGNDVADFYEFTVGQVGEFAFELSNLGADADLYLVDGSGEVIDYSTFEGTQAEIISADLAAGTYSLGVYSYDGVETTYSLNISTSIMDSSLSAMSADPMTTSFEESSIV